MLKKCFSYLLVSCLLLASTTVTAKPLLTVYTYASFAAEWGPGPAIKNAFEKECDCQIKFIALEDGVSMFNRLRLEGKNSKADVVIGLDNNLLAAAHRSGLFAPSNVDTSKLTVPYGWKDDTFVPYDYGYFAFEYNKNTLKNPPTSLQQLVYGDQPVRIIYQDPRTSTPGLGLMLWMKKVFGDQAATAWQKLAKKTVTVTKGWDESYGLFLKGEADMVLSYTTSPAYHIITENNDNYVAASFSEGHYLQVEVAARLASSQHPQLAERFLQFMLTTEFQQRIPTTNWMYPVLDLPLPDGFKQLSKPKIALEFTPEQVEAHRAQWVNEWLQSVSH